MIYIAFLRGINVGGNEIVKMEELRKAFESLELTNVKTLLASGNVLFQTEEADLPALQRNVEEHLEKTFGHKINDLLRTSKQIQSLIEVTSRILRVSKNEVCSVLEKKFDKKITARNWNTVLRLSSRF